MDRVERFVVQVSESNRLLHQGGLARWRISLMLLDNTAELLLKRECDSRLAWNSYRPSSLKRVEEAINRGETEEEPFPFDDEDEPPRLLADVRAELQRELASPDEVERIEREFGPKVAYLQRNLFLTPSHAAVIKRSARRLLELDREIKDADKTIVTRFRSHRWARSIESIPGIGPTLGAEFVVATGGRLEAFGSSGRLASYAGLVPIPQDSGRVSGNLRRPRRYNRRLRWVFYLAAFASLAAKGESWVFYHRKRAEGRKHNQAITCLARRLVDVAWALIRDDREFTPGRATSAVRAAA